MAAGFKLCVGGGCLHDVILFLERVGVTYLHDVMLFIEHLGGSIIIKNNLKLIFEIFFNSSILFLTILNGMLSKVTDGSA